MATSIIDPAVSLESVKHTSGLVGTYTCYCRFHSPERPLLVTLSKGWQKCRLGLANNNNANIGIGTSSVELVTGFTEESTISGETTNPKFETKPNLRAKLQSQTL